MSRLFRHFVALAAVLTVVLGGAVPALAGLPPEVPESAHGEGSVEEGNPRVETRLIVERTSVPAGETLRAGVHFELDPDWHIYWRNSGDAGMSTEVRWSGEALEFGDLGWPAPSVFEESRGEIVTFGYADEVVLFAPVTVADEASGKVTIEAKVDYLACKVDCIPGAATMSRTVKVADEAKPSSEKQRELLDAAASQVPTAPEQRGVRSEVVYSQKPIRPGDTVRAAIGLDFCAKGLESCRDWKVAGEVESHRFIPDSTSQVSWKTLGVTDHPTAKKGAALVLEGKASANEPGEDERFVGIVHLKSSETDGEDGTTTRAIRIDASIPRGSSEAEVEKLEPTLLDMSSRNLDLEGGATSADTGNTESASAASTSDRQRRRVGFWQALLFAFLGGMILNLMPCVFPVLALKVTSFAELVHEDKSHALLHGAAYAVGIVGSMLVLALAVLGLRAAGTEVGWGFQFQNPVFPAVLAAFVVVFAMNLFGIFEIHVAATGLATSTREASGLRRSLAEGVLAVVLATPCSAPFLGTAVGFALTGSAATVVVVFVALGFGLAAPFVVLMLVPGWSTVLPDPGPWMVQIRKVLGFALLGAAIWLVWVVGRSTSVDGMVQLLTLLGATAFAVWVFGVAQESDWEWPALGLGVVAGGVLAAGWVVVRPLPLGGWTQILAGLGIVATLVALVAFQRVREWGFAGFALGASLIVAGGVGILTLDFDARRDAQASAATDEQDSTTGLDWKKWSENRVRESLDQGRPVFVDFTADWCITCKVNERTVLASREVQTAFQSHDVVALKADWTTGDARIQKKLKSFGKAGVPLYLVYDPREPGAPAVLPEVLTPQKVAAAVEKAAPASDG